MSAADLFCVQQIEMRRLTCAVRSGGATCHLELKELTAMRLVGTWISMEAQWLFLFPRRNAESAGNANEWSPLSWKLLPEVSWHSGIDNVEFSYFSHPMFEFLSLPLFFILIILYIWIQTHWVFQLPLFCLSEVWGLSSLSHRAKTEWEADSQDKRY